MGWTVQLCSPKRIGTEQLSYIHQYLKLNKLSWRIINYIISYACCIFRAANHPLFKTKLITITSSFLYSEVSGGFDVDQDVFWCWLQLLILSFSDPEVSWHSLAALIILSSLSLKNRWEASRPVAGNDPRPVVTPELYAGMGKLLIDFSQTRGRDHSHDLTI